MNEAFAENMTGKTVSFDVQPYEHGRGTITKVTPRQVKAREFSAENGTKFVTYECFDLEIAVDEGSHTGALLCGVPVRDTVKSTAGQVRTVIGVSYGQLYRAVEKCELIVRVCCG